MIDKTPSTIYLIPGDSPGGYDWCDDPAPSVEHGPDEAIKYVKATESSRSPAGYPVWISVKVELPKPNICVDIYFVGGDADGRFTDMFYDPNNNCWWGWCKNGKEKWLIHTGVTHWSRQLEAPAG